MPKFKVSQKAEDDLMEIGIYTENKWGVDQRDLYLDDIEKSLICWQRTLITQRQRILTTLY